MNNMTLDDPIAKFSELYSEAAKRGTAEPDAMVLSTVDADGRPSGRYVLLKDADHRGFVFFTNLESRKARALAAHPDAALCFYWPMVDTQVRVEGKVEPVSDQEADDYFATRPRESQIGAWASTQSATLDARESLEERVRGVGERFDAGKVPRPPFWSGFRVVPTSIEFWTRHPARLHDRALFTRTDGGWLRTLLYP
jgi:pyridoxamine 5'-phosphate oxidase